MGRSTVESKGCKVIRVTEEHDQTTEAGFQWLVDQVGQIPKDKPIFLWGSIPCTGGTPWARYNLRRYPDTFPARLRMLRTQWRRMTYNFYRMVDLVRKRRGDWALEWPSRCEYWQSPQVLDFLRRQKSQVYEATATGCAFNLRAKYGKEKGRKMNKAWHVKSSMSNVAEFLDRSCTCPSNYVHAKAEGQNTVITGCYTPEFVAAVHRMYVAHIVTENAPITK